MRIINKKFVEAPTADFNSGKATIGTGAYKFTSWAVNDNVTLTIVDGFGSAIGINPNSTGQQEIGPSPQGQ